MLVTLLRKFNIDYWSHFKIQMVKTSRFEETCHLSINCLNILRYYVGRWGLYASRGQKEWKKKKKKPGQSVDTKQSYMLMTKYNNVRAF